MSETLQQFIDREHITAEAEYADDNPQISDMPPGSRHWRVIFRRGRRRMTIPFSQGPALHDDPTAVDVLDCVVSDSSSIDQPFEHWAADLGWDSDSRKAERCYRACVRQAAKLRQFLGESFEAAMQAER